MSLSRREGLFIATIPMRICQKSQMVGLLISSKRDEEVESLIDALILYLGLCLFARIS